MRKRKIKISLSALILSIISVTALTLTATSPSSGMIAPTIIVKANPIKENKLPPKDQMVCLAKNVYFEAMSESFVGQLSVIAVTLNRVADSRFPNTICDVVWQGPMSADSSTRFSRRNSCQFSWTCDKKSDKVLDQKAWARAQEVAEIGLKMYNNGYDITEGSTHYHATYVLPNWRSDKDMQRVGKVGQHIFYRWNS